MNIFIIYYLLCFWHVGQTFPGNDRCMCCPNIIIWLNTCPWFSLSKTVSVFIRWVLLDFSFTCCLQLWFPDYWGKSKAPATCHLKFLFQWPGSQLPDFVQSRGVKNVPTGRGQSVWEEILIFLQYTFDSLYCTLLNVHQ